MKKLFLFFVAALVISCSEDDTPVIVDNGLHNPYTGSVVGTWAMTGLRINEDVVDLDCELEMPFEENYVFRFYEDNTFDLYSNCEFDPALPSAAITSGTYQTNGNVLTLVIDGQEGKAHMIDWDEYLELEDSEQLAFKFSIGSGESLFYGYDFAVERVPELE